MKPHPSSENEERDQEIIELLQSLRSFESKYPPELLAARRAAFVAQIERLERADIEEGLNPGDEKIVKLLGNLRSAKTEYPPDLLAARRSVFLQQIEGAGSVSLLNKLRFSVKNLFQDKGIIPAIPLANLKRTSLVVAVFMIAALMGSLLFSYTEQGVAQPTRNLPTSTYETGTIICSPDTQAPPCSTRELDSSHDLADQANGAARPAVSKDARSSYGAVYQAAYVNDGRSDTSWVSNSAHSWIKIDLGKVTTINTVTLLKGSVGSSDADNPGQFVIAVALSDVYSDGNSSNDYTEYAQVFNSEQTGFSGTVSQGETVRTFFPAVKARFVKLTFERAGATIEEVGVFMIQPPELAGHPRRMTPDGMPEVSATLVSTNISLPMDRATATPTDTWLPTNTPIPSFTHTPHPSDTPIPLLTNTLPSAHTATSVPINPLPSNTPIPSSTVVPPTAIPPTLQSFPESPGPIIVTGNDQNLTFTCNDNAVEVRGHANTVTLLGSCSSITVTGNGNQIFWQSGSPVIRNNGNENLISQR